MFRSRQCILVRIFNVDDFGGVIILCERLAGTVGIIERIAGLPTGNRKPVWHPWRGSHSEKIRFVCFAKCGIMKMSRMWVMVFVRFSMGS